MIRPNRIVQAIERNPEQMWRLLAENSDKAAIHEAHGAMGFSLNYAHPLFNSVVLTDCVPGKESAAIRTAMNFYAARQMPWHWVVGSTSRPHGFGRVLEDHGFVLSHETPGMALDLHGYSDDGADVIEVEDMESLKQWVDLVLRGFSLPSDMGRPFLELHARLGFAGVPVRYFHVDDKATAMTYYGAGAAGIYCVATLPEARRQGCAERVVRACLAGAVEDGYDLAILHSSKMGLPLYEKLGFHEYCRLAFFAPPQDSMQICAQ